MGSQLHMKRFDRGSYGVALQTKPATSSQRSPATPDSAPRPSKDKAVLMQSKSSKRAIREVPGSEYHTRYGLWGSESAHEL